MKTGDDFVSASRVLLGLLVRSAVLMCLALTLPVAIGCGGGASGPQGKVSGKVTYKGSPIATGATVSFIAEAGGGAAAGNVGPDGSYQLRSMNGDQIPAGKYKVMITPPKGPEKSAEEAMKASMPKEGGTTNPIQGPASDPTIPDQYRSLAKTPANFEVKAGDNVINIELQDK
jgi:hypothetical protein